MQDKFDEETLESISAIVRFKRFDIMRFDHAMWWFGKNDIQSKIITIPPPNISGTPVELVTIRLTNRGRKIASFIEKTNRAEVQKYGLDQDPYLSIDPDDEHLYLMHERRFWREDEGDNPQKLVDCYAMGPEVTSWFKQ